MLADFIEESPALLEKSKEKTKEFKQRWEKEGLMYPRDEFNKDLDAVFGATNYLSNMMVVLGDIGIIYSTTADYTKIGNLYENAMKGNLSKEELEKIQEIEMELPQKDILEGIANDADPDDELGLLTIRKELGTELHQTHMATEGIHMFIIPELRRIKTNYDFSTDYII